MALFDTEHKTLPLGSNHRIQDLEFADEPTRDAVVYTADDLGKVYRTLDTNTWWLLVAQTAGVGTFVNMGTGGGGGGGGTLPVTTVVVPFSFGDVSPFPLTTTLANATVLEAMLIILTPFDAATLYSIGDPGLNTALMDTIDNDTLAAATYETTPNKEYVAATALNLYKSGPAATVGNGLVLLTIKE